MAEGGDENFSGPHSSGRNSKRLRTLSWVNELKSRTLPSYFKSEYKENILDALDVIEKDVLLGRSVHWDMVIPVVRAMRVNSETTPECLKFVRELFRLFEKYSCTDVAVISEVFLFMIFLTTYNLDMDESREINKYFRVPYGDGRTDIDIVYDAVRCANIGLLKILLKFGLVMMTPKMAIYSCFQYTEALLTLRRSNSADEGFQDYIRTGEKLNCNFNPESRKRLLLVLRIVDIVRTMQRNPEHREQFIECYRLLFDSMPEAHVTSSEVKAYLEKCLPETCSALIAELAEAFERQLPELVQAPQPRSLKHLCRIQIRQNLRQNLNLPHGTSSLRLPTKFKEYIMLHDNSDLNSIIRTILENDIWRDSVLRPGPIIIPDRDDCITYFLKQL